MVRGRVIGLQLDRLLILRVGAGPVPIEMMLYHSQCGVCFTGIRIKFESFQSGGARLRVSLAGGEHLIIRHEIVGIGETRVGPGVLGIVVDGRFKIFSGFFHGFGILFGEFAAAAQEIVIGVGPNRAAWSGVGHGGSAEGSRINIRADLGGDIHRDRVLNLHDVSKLWFVGLGPEVTIAPGIDQLHGNADLFAGTDDRSFQDGIHV